MNLRENIFFFERSEAEGVKELIIEIEMETVNAFKIRIFAFLLVSLILEFNLIVDCCYSSSMAICAHLFLRCNCVFNHGLSVFSIKPVIIRSRPEYATKYRKHQQQETKKKKKIWKNDEVKLKKEKNHTSHTVPPICTFAHTHLRSKPLDG